MSKQNKNHRIVIILSSFLAALVLAFFSYTLFRASQFRQIEKAEELSFEEQISLKQIIDSKYAEKSNILKNLPYEVDAQNLDVYAQSAILIDVSNGNIIYEKNADEVIPPASMTKLFAMYVVDEAVSEKKIAYDDIIPLPPESWACNMPPHSSLMFLGEGQIVTLEELLLGLSICSGNDAAYALAYAVSGTMENFIEKMNQIAVDLGLTHTHFVESSGYSEKNSTTAREMASFARIYLLQHPESLQKFHSVKKFTYPKEKNLAPGDSYEAQDFSNGLPRHITMGITQNNTNPLLDILEGCDGLKTGYIDESGYNLALTVCRDGTRFLSVTMKGPGNNNRQGQEGRIHDGTELMEFAFASFEDYFELESIRPYTAKVYCAQKKSLNLVPAFYPESITVPIYKQNFLDGTTSQPYDAQPQIEVYIPQRLEGEIIQGAEYGNITVSYNGTTLERIPLLADRSINKASIITQAADFFIR